MSEEINSITRSIRERLKGFSADAGIILGTGLGQLAAQITNAVTIPYTEIAGFPRSTVKGHAGALIAGILSGRKVVAMQGRFHHYEGYNMKQITLPVRVMRALGASSLIVSNASGGMNPSFSVGDIMLISDHINLFPENPLTGPNDESLGPRFVDMGEAYSRRLRVLAHVIAKEKGITVREGVYAGLSGPCFETPAEYRWLWRIGADAVGMSTVPEVIVAKHAGMEVFGISIITDLGVEGHVEKVSHEQVLAVAAAQEPVMTGLVKELVGRM